MVRPLSRYAERRIDLDLSRVSGRLHAAWIDLVVDTVRAASVPACIVAASGQVSARAVDRLSAACSESIYCRHRVVERLPHLRSADTFAFVAGSEVFSKKLLASFPRIVVRPGAAPARETSRRVSLISSVFNADRFLGRFLDNAAALESYHRFEHFLIRPNSPGTEHDTLVDFVERHPATATYINLPSDPGLYEVWNLGAQLSTAPYLSSANVDDQRAPDHTRVLAAHMDRDKTIDVASTTLRVTTDPTMLWNDSGECSLMFRHPATMRYGRRELVAERREGFAIRDIPHCMPLWHRRLHVLYGYFDEGRYGPSADSEFWLRVASQGGQFLLDGEPRGLYLKDDQSYWSRTAAGYRAEQIAGEYARGGGADSPYLSRLFAEIRQLGRRSAYLELFGRLIVLNAQRAKPLAEKGARLVTALLSHYLGSAASVLDSQPSARTPAAQFDSLIGLIHQAAATVQPHEVVPRRVISGAGSDLTSFT